MCVSIIQNQTLKCDPHNCTPPNQDIGLVSSNNAVPKPCACKAVSKMCSSVNPVVVSVVVACTVIVTLKGVIHAILYL